MSAWFEGEQEVSRRKAAASDRASRYSERTVEPERPPRVSLWQRLFGGRRKREDEAPQPQPRPRFGG